MAAPILITVAAAGVAWTMLARSRAQMPGSNPNATVNGAVGANGTLTSAAYGNQPTNFSGFAGGGNNAQVYGTGGSIEGGGAPVEVPSGSDPSTMPASPPAYSVLNIPGAFGEPKPAPKPVSGIRANLATEATYGNRKGLTKRQLGTSATDGIYAAIGGVVV